MIYPEATQRHSGITPVFGVGLGLGGAMQGVNPGPPGANGILLETGGPDFLLVAQPSSFFTTS